MSNIDAMRKEPTTATDELKDAPVLRNVTRVDPFKVPVGYFDRLPRTVMARIHRTTRTDRWMGWWWPATAAMATVALVFFLRSGRTATDPGHIASGTGSPTILAEHVLDHIDTHDLLAELAAEEAAIPHPGAGFSTEELAAYLDHAELPLELLTEQP